MPNWGTIEFIGLFCIILMASDKPVKGSDDHKHAQALKDFVPDHPNLHELVDKTHKEGDMEAKNQFERESLSVRFNSTKSRLPPTTNEEHVVLHFLDDYTAHVTGGQSDHKFMELEPFIDMLNEHDDLRERLVNLGEKLEKAECDFSCMGDNLTGILNEAMTRMTKREDL